MMFLVTLYSSRHRLRISAVVALLAGLGLLLSSVWPGSATAAGSHAAVADLKRAIDPISAGHISRVIDVAHEDGAEVLIIRVDTPGGRLDSTLDMVEAIFDSQVPVVAYVAPQGAIAASAGTFIVAAANVAAMAPSTSIGAASPVGAAGEDLPETLERKATEIAASTLRGIAVDRGRNSEALEETVINAKSYSATEALELNVIDVVASDLDELLSTIDGWVVETKAGTVTLQTDGLPTRDISHNALERFLGVIADPNVVFVLFAVGGLGIIAELFNPGTFIPGTIGVVCLALSFVAAGSMPVNWIGVALMGFAMLLFFGELQASGVGVLGIVGGVAFVIGGFLLFGDASAPDLPAPSIRVSLWVLGTVSVVLFAIMAILIRFALAAKAVKPYLASYRRLIGRIGSATTVLNPQGAVQVGSEMWSAVSATGEEISEGERVIVLDVEGLTIQVDKAPPDLI